MQIVAISSDRWKGSQHLLRLALCAFLTCICEIEVALGTWITPQHSIKLVQAILLPIFVLLPLLIGLWSLRETNKLANAGEISAKAVKAVSSAISSIALVASAAMMLLTGIAFPQ